MAKDFIGYQQLTDDALRGVVRNALRRVEKTGLVAAHHFRITFKTPFPGVDIPDFLREQYPEEMTIIMQHQYWGLKVKEEQFEVTLSFRKIPATLTVPFAALTQFVDPGVQFGLQFREIDEDGELKPVTAPTPLVQPLPVKEEPAQKATEEPEKPAAPAEVVSLDAFRRNRLVAINAINDYIDGMASITIRNLEDSTKKNLRRRAAENGRSLEAEARAILNQNAHAPSPSAPKTGLDSFRGIREVVEKYGGVELEIPPRTPMRPIHLFEDDREFRSVPPVKARPKRRK